MKHLLVVHTVEKLPQILTIGKKDKFIFNKCNIIFIKNIHMDEVLNPYSVRANGVVRNYLYPKWVYINSEYVRIDPESKVNVTTGRG